MSRYDAIGIPRTKQAAGRSLIGGLLGAAAGAAYYGLQGGGQGLYEEQFEGNLPGALAAGAIGGAAAGHYLGPRAVRAAQPILEGLVRQGKRGRPLASIPLIGRTAGNLAANAADPAATTALAKGINEMLIPGMVAGAGSAAAMPLGAAVSEKLKPTTGEKIRGFFGDEVSLTDRALDRVGIKTSSSIRSSRIWERLIPRVAGGTLVAGAMPAGMIAASELEPTTWENFKGMLGQEVSLTDRIQDRLGMKTAFRGRTLIRGAALHPWEQGADAVGLGGYYDDYEAQRNDAIQQLMNAEFHQRMIRELMQNEAGGRRPDPARQLRQAPVDSDPVRRYMQGRGPS